MIRFCTHDIHPLAMIETRSKHKTKDNKQKSKNSHKREMLKNNGLKEPNKMIHKFLMPFTRVPAQLDRREESNGLISSSQQQKLKNNKEGHQL
jgi:hypothetical protein